MIKNVIYNCKRWISVVKCNVARKRMHSCFCFLKEKFQRLLWIEWIFNIYILLAKAFNKSKAFRCIEMNNIAYKVHGIQLLLFVKCMLFAKRNSIEIECIYLRHCSTSLHLIPINIVYQYLFWYYRIFWFIPATHGNREPKNPIYLKILAFQQQPAKDKSEKSRKEKEKALSEIKTMRLFYCYVSLGIHAYIRGVWHVRVCKCTRKCFISKSNAKWSMLSNFSSETACDYTAW